MKVNIERRLKVKLKKDPYNISAVNDLSTILLRKNRPQEAEILLNKALLKHKSNINLLSTLAVTKVALNRKDAAKIIFDKIISLSPKHTDTYFSLGNLFAQENNHKQAIINYKKAIEYKTNNITVYNNLASMLFKINALEEAKNILLQAINIKPNNASCLKNLGIIAQLTGNRAEAEKYFKQTLQITPKDTQVLIYISQICFQNKNDKDAIKYINKSLDINKQNADAYLILAKHEFNKQNYADAILLIEKCIKFEKKLSLLSLGLLYKGLAYNCDLEKLSAVKNKIELSLKENNYADILEPFDAVISIDDPMLQAKAIRHWAEILENRTGFIYNQNKIKNSEKIRIAYMSSNFSEHAIGFLLNNLFALHDRNKFEIIAILTRTHESDFSRKILKTFDQIINVSGLIAKQAAELIYQQDINILVDLNGHMPDNRLDILAYQPAPIQCHWLGYTGTLGAKFIQYYIADPILVSKELAETYTEKIVQLPIFYACSGFEHPKKLDIHSDYDLPKDKFIYCCHAREYRITEQLLLVWVSILDAVPDSVLWLSTKNITTKKQLLNLFVKHGIDEQRIIISDYILLSKGFAPHLADLWLDTFNFSSGTAAILCAWLGVPVLSLLSSKPQCRVSAACMTGANLQELVVYSNQEYINKAIELGRDPSKLLELKNKLLSSKDKSKLFDNIKFIKHLERGYKIIIDDFLKSTNTKVLEVMGLSEKI